MMYIPEGYGTVFPYLIVNDIDRFVGFLKTVFDAKELVRMADPSGKIGHAEIKIGDSMTLNVLGRSFEGKIASLRKVDFTTGGTSYTLDGR